MTRDRPDPNEADRLCVRDVMTGDVVSLSLEASLGLVGEVMQLGHFRHVPVVDAQGRVVGLVTHRDLIREMARALDGFDDQERRWFGSERVARSICARDIIRKNPLTVAPDTSLLQAARMIKANKYGCLPVTNESGHLVGIITEADFVQLAELWLEAQTDMRPPSRPAKTRHSDVLGLSSSPHRAR